MQEVAGDVTQFIRLFWTLTKLQQDTYVPNSFADNFIRFCGCRAFLLHVTVTNVCLLTPDFCVVDGYDGQPRLINAWVRWKTDGPGDWLGSALQHDVWQHVLG